MLNHPLLQYFAFDHLPVERLRLASAPFWECACTVVANTDPGPMLDMALQHLLIAKDAAVRAALPLD